jgi:hypothetical protein
MKTKILYIFLAAFCASQAQAVVITTNTFDPSNGGQYGYAFAGNGGTAYNAAASGSTSTTGNQGVGGTQAAVYTSAVTNPYTPPAGGAAVTLNYYGFAVAGISTILASNPLTTNDLSQYSLKLDLRAGGLATGFSNATTFIRINFDIPDGPDAGTDPDTLLAIQFNNINVTDQGANPQNLDYAV